MAVEKHPYALGVINNNRFPISDGVVELDESWSPYCQGSIAAPFTDSDAVIDIDPRAVPGPRATVRAAVDGAWEPYTPWAESRRNLHRNPRAATTGAVAGAFYSPQSSAESGTFGPAISSFSSSWRSTRVGSTGAIALRVVVPKYKPSTTYRARIIVRASLAVAAGAATIQLRPDVGSGSNGSASVALPALTAGTAVTIDVLLTSTSANPNANNRPGFVIVMPSIAAGSYIEGAGIMVEENGTVGASYFDGTNNDTATTRFTWAEAPNASESIRDARSAAPPGVATWNPGPVRSFDLGIRSREVDYRERVVRMTLASDEALLQDYASLTDDQTPRPMASSLRAVCNYVLGKIGAALASGTGDANVTPLQDAVNLIRNPRVASATTDWLATWTAGGYVVNRQTSGGPSYAPTYVDMYQNQATGGSTGCYLYVSEAVTPISPGQTYLLSVSVNVSQGAPSGATLDAIMYDQGGAIVGFTNVTPVTGATWQRISVKFTAPAGAVKLRPRVNVAGTFAYGGVVKVTAFRLSPGTGWDDDDVVYFDGSTTDTTEYDYNWPQGSTPHASSSNRTMKITTRPTPAALVWNAGQPGWEFLGPVLTAASFRLFCDESRVWRLVPPTYSLPTVIPLVPAQSVEATDTISRDDGPWATGVAVIYEWNDPLFGAQRVVDAAGTSTKVAVITYNTPFPGPGAAAARLAAITARGRVQDVEVLTDYTATPGMSSHIPVTAGTLTGRVRSVRFELPRAVMSVSSKDQAELTPGMIDALTGTIDALVGTIDSL